MTSRARKKGDPATGLDLAALIQAVLRESYLEAAEDLRGYAEKVRHFNRRKKAVREYLAALREFKTEVLSAARERGIDLCRDDKHDRAALARIFRQYARPYKTDDCEYELSISNRVPRAGTDSIALLDHEIARWDEQLAAMGDDAQLASIELQNALQKQQQYLQMMSNLSKTMHDAAMAVIRNLKG